MNDENDLMPAPPNPAMTSTAGVSSTGAFPNNIFGNTPGPIQQSSNAPTPPILPGQASGASTGRSAIAPAAAAALMAAAIAAQQRQQQQNQQNQQGFPGARQVAMQANPFANLAPVAAPRVSSLPGPPLPFVQQPLSAPGSARHVNAYDEANEEEEESEEDEGKSPRKRRDGKVG